MSSQIDQTKIRITKGETINNDRIDKGAHNRPGHASSNINLMKLIVLKLSFTDWTSMKVSNGLDTTFIAHKVSTNR